MKNEFKIKTCTKCGATIEVLKDCTCNDCGIKCCGQEMVEMKPNSVDASFEKHVPNYEIIGNFIVAEVNHVMEDDHYIEYLALSSDNITAKKYFKAGVTPRRFSLMLKVANYTLTAINMGSGKQQLISKKHILKMIN